MKKACSLFAIVFALCLGGAVIDRPASHVGFSTAVVQQARGDEPREVRDPIERFVRLLKRLLRGGTNGDGMTGPKP